MTWGVESEVVDRFTSAGVDRADIACERGTYLLGYPGPPATFLETFLTYYGPSMTALEHAERAGTAEVFKAELRALFERQNQSADPNSTEIPATFLRVTVRKP